MQPIQALNALNVFDLRRVQAPAQAATSPIHAETPKSFAFSAQNYSPAHPRAVDSEGVPAGTSPLGRKLDVCW